MPPPPTTTHAHSATSNEQLISYFLLSQTAILVSQSICQLIHIFMYLYNEVGRGDVTREGAEVDPHSPLLMGWQLGIILIIQGDAREGSSDGGRVTGVHLLEYDWKEVQGDKI